MSSLDLRKRLDEAAAIVGSRSSLQPRVALVLGSGLGAFADTLEQSTAVPYRDLPGIPTAKVAGHAGQLVLGRSGDVPVVAMQGRVHLYEGHSPDEVVFGTRLMLTLGAPAVVITNAAGGVREEFRPGDLMLIEDHLNLTGAHCLTGPNDSTLGERFVDMTRAYDPELVALAARTAKSQGRPLQRGVYAGLLGPTYETPAEVRMLRGLGADAVGMSTVLETIAARHMGGRVLGISCITNQAAGITGEQLSHVEVQETAAQARGRFTALLAALVQEMA